jgi:non-ribosomal peptide synthetase component F
MDASVYPVLPSDGYRPAAIMSLERLMKFGARSDPKVASTIVKLAWSILLSHYTDSEEVVFGVTATGRGGSMPGIGIMSGVAIANTPFRVRLQSDMWVGEALHGVQEQETRMIPVEQLELHTISRLSADAAAASQFRNSMFTSHAARTSSGSDPFP